MDTHKPADVTRNVASLIAADPPSVEEYLECAVEVAREAGELVRSAYRSSRRLHNGVHTKGLREDAGAATTVEVFIKDGNALDLVTEVDRKCEQLIFGRLRERFPQSRLIGEEDVGGGQKAVLTDAPTWIVDPIDGTTNFVHGHPSFYISIGLSIGRVPTTGVVYNPITEELFTAIKSKGAFLNRTMRLPLYGDSVPARLNTALVSTEWGADRNPEILCSKLGSVSRMLARQSEAGGQVHGLRSSGSCVSNMCEVARGSIDMYWEFGVHCWDIAAGTVIVRESGGTVVTCEGRWREGEDLAFNAAPPSDIDLLGRRVLCVRAGEEVAKESLIAEALRLIEDIPYERD